LGFDKLGDGAVEIRHPPTTLEVFVERVEDGYLIGCEKGSVAGPQGIDATVTDPSVESGPTNPVTGDGIGEG